MEVPRDERRKYPRLNMAVGIQYRIGSQAAEYNSGAASNISAGGICLILYQEAKEGSVVDLNINLPDGQPPIMAAGRVRWVKPFNVAQDQQSRSDAGVEFVNINEENKKRIANYVFGLK